MRQAGGQGVFMSEQHMSAPLRAGQQHAAGVRTGNGTAGRSLPGARPG